MSWGSPFFVLAIIAMSTIGWIITTAIRAKHGYPVEGEWGNHVHKGLPDAERRFELLGIENEALTGKVARLEERVSVLERIATDGSTKLVQAIDALR